MADSYNFDTHPVDGQQRASYVQYPQNFQRYTQANPHQHAEEEHRPSTASSASSIVPEVIQRLSDPESDELARTIERVRLVRFEPLPDLKWYDVASLIITKMVGTGILTGPPIVLRYTGSKNIAMGLWLGGFLYTVIK